MQYTLIRLLLPLWLAGVVVPGAAAVAQRSTPAVTDIDRIVAVINDGVITETELERRLIETKRQLALEKINVPPDPVLKKQLLDRMVTERIQLQLAAQLGIRVSENDLDKAIESITSRNKLTVEQFDEALEAQGIDIAVYRDQIRDQIAIKQLLEREIGNRIRIAESEIDSFLKNRKRREDVDTEYDLAHIFVGIPESASPEKIQAVRKKAEEIHRQLETTGDFERLAVTHSESPEALSGGNLGWRKTGQLPELFIKALRELEPGQITPPLPGPNGFHIVKLIGRRGGMDVEPVLQTHARHILLRPNEIQSLAEARSQLLQLRARIEHGEDFAALARAHSEDTVSATNGGDLGWVNPGDLVPEFEKVMNTLNLRELSAPVETPFGLHLIQVIERRTQDVSQDRLRSVARRQIHARKADQRYEQWVRQLRDEAYVEYMLEDVN